MAPVKGRLLVAYTDLSAQQNWCKARPKRAGQTHPKGTLCPTLPRATRKQILTNLPSSPTAHPKFFRRSPIQKPVVDDRVFKGASKTGLKGAGDGGPPRTEGIN